MGAGNNLLSTKARESQNNPKNVAEETDMRYEKGLTESEG